MSPLAVSWKRGNNPSIDLSSLVNSATLLVSSLPFFLGPSTCSVFPFFPFFFFPFFCAKPSVGDSVSAVVARKRATQLAVRFMQDKVHGSAGSSNHPNPHFMPLIFFTDS